MRPYGFMYLLRAAVPIVAWLIALLWLFKLLEAWRGLARVPNLLAAAYAVASAGDPPAGDPAIAVIVPAREEAANITACLESLLRQDCANLRVIAIDDRSSDNTGVIMDALGRLHEARCEVIHITRLPAGWLGKTHAMATGARHAIATYNPDYLLFTDADVVFQPDAIRRSLAHASASRADHLIVLPTTIARTSGESMLLAYLQVLGFLAVRPWRVADPKAMRDALGVGAFNLIRSSAYQQLGGFDAMRMEIVEDRTLGRRVKSAGLRQRVATAPGMVCLHWAAGVRGIVKGMTKNTFAVFHFRVGLLVAAAAGIVLCWIAPIALLAFVRTRVPAAFALAAITGLYTLASRTSRISPLYAMLFPVAAIIAVYAMLRSMLVTLRDGGVTWRGTFYPLAELRGRSRSKA